MGFSWVKVHANLPDHPKSIALAAELGIDLAEAYPVRLWGWCLTNAPTGRIASRHATAVVEAACRWRGERGVLFQALLSVGFLDDEGDFFVIHNWDEEQRPSVEKAARDAEKKRERRESGAKTARAEKAPTASLSQSQSQSLEAFEKGVQGEEFSGGDENETVQPDLSPLPSQARPLRRAEDLQAVWNRSRPQALPEWKGMSKTRRARAVMRLGDRPISEWEAVIARVRASPFCLGQNDRGWVANADWLLKPDTADKVLEGTYDARAGKQKLSGEVSGDFAAAVKDMRRDGNGDLVWE